MMIQKTYQEWKDILGGDQRPLEKGARNLCTVAMFIALMANAVSNGAPIVQIAGMVLITILGFRSWKVVSCKKPFVQGVNLMIISSAAAFWVFIDNEMLMPLLGDFLCLWTAITHSRMKTKQDAAKMFGPIIMACSLALLQSESILTGLLVLLAIGLNLIGMSWGAQRTTIRFHFRSAIWSVTKVMFLVLPIALAMFFLFPRVPLGFNNAPGEQGNQATTGMSKTMTPGSVSDMAKDKKIAFTVDFKTDIPPSSSLYWKATVLDRFNGKTWTSTDDRINDNSESPRPVTSIPVSYQWDYEIALPASMMDFLPILDSTIQNSVAVGVPQPGAYLSHPTPAGIHTKVNFDGYSVSVRGKISGAGIELSSKHFVPPRVQDTSLPKYGNPKTKELAQQWRREADQKGADVSFIIEKFQKHIYEGPYRYTLKPNKWGPDGIDQFLFSDKAGFCEHYATALVFLLRSAGYPSRIAIGYQGAEIDGLKARVLSQNAHAWTEVWFEGKGWKRVDPTGFINPSRVEPDVEEHLKGKSDIYMRMTAWSESASNYWNESIVFYDVMKQQDVLEKIFGNPIERAKKLAELTLAVILMVLIWKKTQKLRSKRLPFHQKSEAIYKDILVSCRKLGVESKETATPHELMEAVQAKFASKRSNEFLTLIQKIKTYEKARYGH